MKYTTNRERESRVLPSSFSLRNIKRLLATTLAALLLTTTFNPLTPLTSHAAQTTIAVPVSLVDNHGLPTSYTLIENKKYNAEMKPLFPDGYTNDPWNINYNKFYKTRYTAPTNMIFKNSKLQKLNEEGKLTVTGIGFSAIVATSANPNASGTNSSSVGRIDFRINNANAKINNANTKYGSTDVVTGGSGISIGGGRWKYSL